MLPTSCSAPKACLSSSLGCKPQDPRARKPGSAEGASHGGSTSIVRRDWCGMRRAFSAPDPSCTSSPGVKTPGCYGTRPSALVRAAVHGTSIHRFSRAPLYARTESGNSERSLSQRHSPGGAVPRARRLRVLEPERPAGEGSQAPPASPPLSLPGELDGRSPSSSSQPRRAVPVHRLVGRARWGAAGAARLVGRGWWGAAGGARLVGRGWWGAAGGARLVGAAGGADRLEALSSLG